MSNVSAPYSSILDSGRSGSTSAVGEGVVFVCLILVNLERFFPVHAHQAPTQGSSLIVGRNGGVDRVF